MNFLHSGTLGDLIYSLSIVKKLDNQAHFLVALNNIESVVARYGYRPEEVDPAHRGRFFQQDYQWLQPLLQAQPYIASTGTWQSGDPAADYDLDKFRGTLFRGFEGNYVEAYHKAFNLEFDQRDYVTPWLTAEPIHTAPIVISRTARYRDPAGDAVWKNLAQQGQVDQQAVFVGTEWEHQDFIRATGVAVPYRPVSDFLELAGIVAAAELVMANQNFVFSLAMGLGRDAVLETIKIKPLINNECYFPRPNVQYW